MESVTSSIDTVRRLLPADTKAMYLLDFLKEYAPELPIDKTDFLTASDQVLSEMVISPTEGCTVLRTVRRAVCREPLHTLMDDVVWLLLQRRTRSKQRGEDYRNALLQGFVAARNGEQAPAGMRLGVARSQRNSINENLGYCKTSPIIHQLHSLVGDDVLRMILTQTRLFLPLQTTQNKGNYILLCGPPLPNPSYMMDSATNSNNSTSSEQQGSANSKNRKGRKRKLCRSGFQDEVLKRKKKKRLHANDYLSRFALFYVDSYTPHVGLPRSHVLKQDPPCSPIHLLATIFNLSPENKNKQRRVRRRLGECGLRICRDMLTGHSRCDYHRLLERYCAFPSHILVTDVRNGDTTEIDPLARLAKAFTPQDRVASFVVAVLRRVFPDEFWGTESNFRSIVSSVHTFVHLRRKERLANKTLMNNISISRMQWLFNKSNNHTGKSKQGCRRRNAPRSSHETATNLALTVFRWLFEGYIIPLLRTNFYVTETEFSAQKVQYYRRPIWSLFRSLALKKIVNGNHFTQVSFPTAKALLREHEMGVSRLRLLPKSTGVRPIAQLSRRQNVSFLWTNKSTGVGNSSSSISKRVRMEVVPGDQNRQKKRTKMEASQVFCQSELPPWFPPTNTLLSEVFDVLRYECSKRHQPFGVGIDSLELFYPKYRDFVARLRSEGRKDLPLYFATVDVEKCFDRIDQESLLNFVEDLIDQHSYVVRLIKVHSTVRDPYTGNEVPRIRFLREVDSLDGHQTIHTGQMSMKPRTQQCLLDLSKCTLAEREKIFMKLREHISSNLVVTSGRFSKKVLLQASGISQGSTLSTTLCNFYYGMVEKSIFTGDDALELKSRFVDDFLLICTEQEKLQGYLSNLYKGVPSLGVKVNFKKSLASVTSKVRWENDAGETNDVLVPNGCYRDPTGRSFFPWCGLLFDTSTGEVSIDYTRFYGDKPLESLTVDSTGMEGSRMKRRIESFVFPRCLPILFDPYINSIDKIITNYLQMMLFGAIKTKLYLLSFQMQTSSKIDHVDHVVRCVEGLPNFAARNIRGKAQGSKESKLHFKFPVNHFLASYLTLWAFHEIFSSCPEFQDLTKAFSMRLEPFSSLPVSPDQKSRIRIAISRGFDSFCSEKFTSISL